MNRKSDQEAVCCPKYEPSLWDDKTLEWQKKQFVKARVFTLFYMPMNFGSVIRKLDKKVREAGANMQDNLCLSDHTSKWNMDIYVAVDKDVPGALNTTISGKFYSKVYEGPYNDTAKWCRNYEETAKSMNMGIKKWYMWYTTCPECAKKYGKNYVAIMGQVG
jgi:hypothetical protein